MFLYLRTKFKHILFGLIQLIKISIFAHTQKCVWENVKDIGRGHFGRVF